MSSRLIRREDGIDILALENDDLKVEVMSLGASILKLEVKDRNGEWKDVVMGYESLADYPKYRAYLGALVGRVANRIAKGQFTINGVDYQLPINNGPNCNHGGIDGFAFANFDWELMEDRIRFFFTSPDGHEGFPGEVKLQADYILEGKTLRLEYRASSNADTLLSITNHSYFNLEGAPVYVGDHQLEMRSDAFACVDKDGLVTGEIRPVDGSVFDFRQEKRIGDALESDDLQIETGYGLDHPFHIEEGVQGPKAIVYAPGTGIEMRMDTSLPYVQLYSANWFNGEAGKDGKPMGRNCSIAFETEQIPDDIHLNAQAPATLLKKDEPYFEWTTYSFDVR